MRQIVLEEDLGDEEDYDQQSDGEANASNHTRDDISEEAEEEDDDDDDQDTERRESTVTIEQAQAQHEAEGSDSDEGASPPISALSSGLRGVAIKSAAGRPPIRLVRQEHPLKTEQTAADSEDEDDDDDDDDELT